MFVRFTIHFLNKVAGRRNVTIIKKTLIQMFSCENIFLEEYIWMVASVLTTIIFRDTLKCLKDSNTIFQVVSS